MNNNTYALRTEEVEGIMHYFVAFEDGAGLLREIEVSRPVYLEFLRSAKTEHNQSRWNRRHTERSELTDQSLYERALHKPKSVEEAVLDNLRDERLERAIAELPEIQAKRFVLYYEFGLTVRQIGEIEGKHWTSISESIRAAEGAIKEKLKYFQN